MAQLKVTLTDIQSVVYNSTSKGKIEPNIVKFGNSATWAKPYILTIPVLPLGVASCVVTRSSSYFTGVQTGAIATAGTSQRTSTIYYGDNISVSANASTGYNNPTVNFRGGSTSWNGVTSGATVEITAGAVKSFALSYPAKPTGVSAYTISRTSSPNQGATTGVIVNSPSSAGTVTVYYGDKLSISATAASGYNAPSKSLSQTTVTGNVTATITAGSLAQSWHTLGTSAGTYYSTSGYSKFEISVRCGDTNAAFEFSNSGTQNVSGTYTSGGYPQQCICGETGNHWCACFGEDYDPGYTPITTTNVSGTVVFTKNSNSIVVSTTGSATVYNVKGWG